MFSRESSPGISLEVYKYYIKLCIPSTRLTNSLYIPVSVLPVLETRAALSYKRHTYNNNLVPRALSPGFGERKML